MQLKKVGVLATGALASVGIMGAPADAAPLSGASTLTNATVLTTPAGQGGRSAAIARNELAQPRDLFGDWDAPWDIDAFGLTSTQSGSSLLTSTVQACGAIAGTNIAVTTSDPSGNTVIGDCRNANVDIDKLGPKADVSTSDNASVNALPWQICGSVGAAGAAFATAIDTPNTVIGSCHNANTSIS